jgi:hypothetical protein
MPSFRAPRTTVPGPACHRDAALILTKLNIHYRDVIAVDIDSVLYTTPAKEPRTLWLHRDPQTSDLAFSVQKAFASRHRTTRSSR